MIYLVPESTERDLTIIQGACIDSVVAVANSPVDISLIGLDNELYWLYARDSTGNISKPKAFSIMGVGIEDTFVDQISIYPNPTVDILTIQTGKVGLYSIEINSLNGHILFSSGMKGTTQQIDLSFFRKGVYFITIRSKDFVKTEKIIKL